MKNTGRLLSLLLVLSLLLSLAPASLASTPVPKDDIADIDTIPVTITSPTEYNLNKYYFVNGWSLLESTFTAPKTGTYYFYLRRQDKATPVIQVYTAEHDAVKLGSGTPGSEYVLSVYLKKGYKYIINNTYSLPDGVTQQNGIYIASCLPGSHMEPHMDVNGNYVWETILAPANGKSGKKGCYCDFCHQVALTKVIPAIPYNVRATGITFQSVKLKWSPAENATSYEIYQRKGSASASAKLVGKTKKSTYHLTVSNLVMGKTYYFQVKAVTKDGTSDFSAAVSVVPTLKAPKSFKAESTSVGKVKLTWKKVTGASGYLIYRADKKDGTYRKVSTVEGEGSGRSARAAL